MSGQENRYATIDLFISSDLHERVSSVVVTGGGGQNAPFDRQIDLWWAGVTVGVVLGYRTQELAAATKFNVGSILNSDPWRIVHLELLAVAEEGADVLDSPRKVIQIASEYANTGVRWLADRLVGEPEPILALANAINEFREHESY